MSQELDSNIKVASLEEAEKIYENIFEASIRPDKSITGDYLKIYNKLSSWEFFEKYPISDLENKWLYVTLISMNIYDKLFQDKKDKDNGIKKPSKWEVVMGKMGQR